MKLIQLHSFVFMILKKFRCKYCGKFKFSDKYIRTIRIVEFISKDEITLHVESCGKCFDEISQIYDMVSDSATVRMF